MASIICFELLKKNISKETEEFIFREPNYNNLKIGKCMGTGKIPLDNSILFSRCSYNGLLSADNGKTFIFKEDYKQQKSYLDELRRSGKKYSYSDYFRINDDHFINIINLLSKEGSIILTYVDNFGDEYDYYEENKKDSITITSDITNKTVFSYYKRYLIKKKTYRKI